MSHMCGGCHLTTMDEYLPPYSEMKKHYISSSHVTEETVLTALNTKGGES